MLGLAFTEFMEMVENNFSDDVYMSLLDLAENSFESKGDYTGVGNYEHSEMLSLVVALSQKTDIPVNDLVEAYGKHLFSSFNERYEQFFTDVHHSFDFLAGIEDRIHSEVRKLYPAAKLPTFICERPDPKTLIMNYESERPFAVLAKGLIAGCVEHFNNTISCEFTDLSDGDSTKALFVLKEAA